MAVRVTTGCRLHFGLLNPSAEPMPRLFGGCGMMADVPALAVTAAPARSWSAGGSLALRAVNIARSLPDPPHPCKITVEEAPPEHAGLGSGTQFALAVAAACQTLWGRPAGAPDLARLTGRGRRSGVGVHGFAHGGFLVDGGHAGQGVAPLVARHPFPRTWRIVLALPEAPPGPSGAAEHGLMGAVAANEALTGALSRLLLLGVLPALAQADLPTFGEALGEYNARAGELFAAAQGGTYTSPAVAVLVAYLASTGVSGVGQSSWGPCVFAICDAERAAWIVGKLAGRARAWVASGRNEGAAIHTLEE